MSSSRHRLTLKTRRARREVREAIKSYGWNPIGHAGYQELRRRIMGGELLNKDLQ